MLEVRGSIPLRSMSRAFWAGAAQIARSPLPILHGEPESQRLGARLCARPHAELAQHGRDVMVDRANRQEEPRRDIGVAEAARNELEHLGLAAGQTGRALPRRRPRPACEPPLAALAKRARDLLCSRPRSECAKLG